MDFSFGRAQNLNEQICPKRQYQSQGFNVHILNNLPKDYDLILDGLENCLRVTRDDALTIDVIREKWNHRCKQVKNKKEEKVKRGKSLGAYNTQYKQWCRKCDNCSHKPGDKRYPENKNEKRKEWENRKI